MHCTNIITIRRVRVGQVVTYIVPLVPPLRNLNKRRVIERGYNFFVPLPNDICEWWIWCSASYNRVASGLGKQSNMDISDLLLIQKVIPGITSSCFTEKTINERNIISEMFSSDLQSWHSCQFKQRNHWPWKIDVSNASYKTRRTLDGDF